MTFIKTSSAEGRFLTFAFFILKFEFGFKLAKLPPCFAKQSQFQNPPINTNPFIAKPYKNRTPTRTTKQTQFKANPNPIKPNLPPLTTQKIKYKPNQTRFEPNKQCTPRGTSPYAIQRQPSALQCTSPKSIFFSVDAPRQFSYPEKSHGNNSFVETKTFRS